MSELEGVYVRKSKRPDTDTQVWHHEVISGTMGGRTVWPIRQDKSKDVLKINQHENIDGNKRQPMYKKGGEPDLTYPKLEHYNKVNSDHPVEEQSRELAETIAKVIKKYNKKQKARRTDD